MNNDNKHLDIMPEGDDEKLRGFFEGYTAAPIDNTRIKMLTHLKIMQEETHRMHRRYQMRMWLAVAASLVMGVFLVASYFNHADQQGERLTAEAMMTGADFNEIEVPAGEQMKLILSDGTQLMANARTTVKYPKKFSGDTRRIQVQGEVFLKVTKDKRHPFVVESNGFNVCVLGTTFCVNNYNPDQACIVLVEGCVEVATELGEKVRMNPNEVVSVAGGSITGKTTVDTDYYTAWTDGAIRLQGDPLETVMARLNQYYGVTISCDSRLAKRQVYGRLEIKSDVDEVLKALQQIIPMHMESKGNHIRLHAIDD